MKMMYWYSVNVFKTSSEDMWKIRSTNWSDMYEKQFKIFLQEMVSVEKRIAILLTKTGFEFGLSLFCYQFLSQSQKKRKR